MKNIKIEENPQRNSNTKYKNKPCQYWNSLLYYSLLDDGYIYGISIDFKDFCIYFNTLEDTKIKQLFNYMKNNMNDSIFLNDFNNFLNYLSNKDYNNLMNCIERDDSLINIDIDTCPDPDPNILCDANNEGLLNEYENRNVFCFDFLENKPNNFLKCIFCGCIV